MEVINENFDRDRSASLLDYFLLRRGRKSVFKSEFYDRQIWYTMAVGKYPVKT